MAHLAIANTEGYGLVRVVVGPWSWTHSTSTLADWVGAGPTDTSAEVVLSFAGPSPR